MSARLQMDDMTVSPKSSAIPFLAGKAFYIPKGPHRKELRERILNAGGTVCQVNSPSCLQVVDSALQISKLRAKDMFVTTTFMKICLDQQCWMEEDYRILNNKTPVKRKAYTAQDDLNMILFAQKEFTYSSSSKALWELAEKQKVTEHSASSMATHFVKFLAKLRKSDEQIEELKERAKMEAQKQQGWSAKQRGELSATKVGELSAKQRGELSATKVGELSANQGGESSATKVGELSAKQRGELSATKVGELSAKQRGELPATKVRELSAKQGGELSASKSKASSVKVPEEKFEDDVVSVSSSSTESQELEDDMPTTQLESIPMNSARTMITRGDSTEQQSDATNMEVELTQTEQIGKSSLTQQASTSESATAESRENQLRIEPTRTERELQSAAESVRGTTNGIPNPETDGVVTEPKSDEVVTEPKSDEVGTEPKSDEVVTEPKSDEVVTEPKSDKVVTEPKPDEVVTEPKSDEVGTEPKSDEVVTEPKSDEVVTEPKSDKVVTEPKPDEVVTEPKPTELDVHSPEKKVARPGSASQKKAFQGTSRGDVRVESSNCATSVSHVQSSPNARPQSLKTSTDSSSRKDMNVKAALMPRVSSSKRDSTPRQPPILHNSPQVPQTQNKVSSTIATPGNSNSGMKAKSVLRDGTNFTNNGTHVNTASNCNNKRGSQTSREPLKKKQRSDRSSVKWEIQKMIEFLMLEQGVSLEEATHAIIATCADFELAKEYLRGVREEKWFWTAADDVLVGLNEIPVEEVEGLEPLSDYRGINSTMRREQLKKTREKGMKQWAARRRFIGLSSTYETN